MTPLAAKTLDRASGALLLLLGIGAIWHAQSLSVPFAADPIGPKAFPTIAGAVLALAGASILLRPEAIEVEAGHRMRVASVAIASLVYPFLLGLGWWYVRSSEAAEQEFAEDVADR